MTTVLDVSEQQASRDTWLLAGQDLLRRGGIAAVKLQALSASLDRTTGSFYHHFGSMSHYLEALADYYGVEQGETTIAPLESLDPIDRLESLIRFSHEAHMHPLSVAMRDWAASDPNAAAAVRASDERLLRFIERALLDLGHTTPQARTRAHLLLAVGVARIDTPWRTPAAFDQRVIEIITTV